MIRCLLEDDAQTFVDVIDEARLHALVIVNILAEIDIDTSRRLGTGSPRHPTTDPKEMPEIVVQDVRPPRTSPEGLEDPCLL